MIGRADIERSKSDVAMNAWPPQASILCGNFSDTSCPAFAVPMLTEHRDQASICPFALRKVSVLAELALGHLILLQMYRPSQTPRLAVSSNRIAKEQSCDF
ncbi:hypothetical protein RN001_006326 [Aquatica leii]|uniref:Uncharacterized protein n=1 Tax=Aquatica leii TaxID=1421715 RepID=A0AAN7SIH7_9COLE|nr:hypothetical protein RN001_006326 [Aquatica leii]